jgi:hypothetical protein
VPLNSRGRGTRGRHLLRTGRDPGSSRGPQNTLWSTWGPRPGSSRHRVPGRRGHRPPAFARLHANQVTPKNPRGGSARQQREHSRPRRSPTSFIVRPRARVTARSLRSHGAHSRPETRTSRLDAPQSTRLRPQQRRVRPLHAGHGRQPRPRHGTARRARRRRLMAVLKSRTNVTATLRDVTQVPAPRLEFNSSPGHHSALGTARNFQQNVCSIFSLIRPANLNYTRSTQDRQTNMFPLRSLRGSRCTYF